jgi:VanZ family protein
MQSGQRGKSQPSGRVRWAYPLALAAAIVFASSQSHVPGVGAPGSDKVVHFAAFGLLATLTVRVLPPSRVWLAVVVVSLFGATDEWHQSFTPGRTMDWADWVADTAGALVAAVAYARWAAYRRLLETPVRSLCRKARIENAPTEASTVAPP